MMGLIFAFMSSHYVYDLESVDWTVKPQHNQSMNQSIRILDFKSELNLLYEKQQQANGPRQANLVLIAYASSKGSGEPANARSLARTFAAHSYNQ